MKPDIFGDVVVATVGPFPLTRTMLVASAVTVVVVVAAALLAGAAVSRPETRTAAVARLGFRFLHDLVAQAAGEPSPALEVFAGTLFTFIAACAVAGQLPGVAAPTSNLAVTSALAAIVFVAVPIAGVRTRGVRAYVKDYFTPNPIFFPLHVISELSRTLALALRLFGNMMSGHLVVALLLSLVGLFVPIPLMALDLGIGLLQAYIFTILACVYVGAAIRIGEEK